MALNVSNSSSLEQLTLKGLINIHACGVVIRDSARQGHGKMPTPIPANKLRSRIGGGGELCENWQFLMVCAVKICKHCLQTAVLPDSLPEINPWTPLGEFSWVITPPMKIGGNVFGHACVYESV